MDASKPFIPFKLTKLLVKKDVLLVAENLFNKKNCGYIPNETRPNFYNQLKQI